ncbi:MAG: chlorite dismutase family protein [Bryobacter sp.]|nr:chlorite dismutase family protein [Bryobacter sp.]
MNPRLYSFAAGATGPWRILSTKAVRGESLPSSTPTTNRLSLLPGEAKGEAAWTLRGVRSNERYATAAEKQKLAAVQEDLGRAEADFAVLIPIRKSAAWWALSQDERRAIFEEQSRHTAIGLEYLPAIARRLFHCRDLATEEPFDFLTWFEFAHDHQSRFDQLLARLRATREWSYVEREVEVRLVRVG